MARHDTTDRVTGQRRAKARTANSPAGDAPVACPQPVGASRNSYARSRTAISPSGLATLTSTVAGVCAGVLAMMVVGLETTTSVAGEPPKATDAPVWKWLPLIVTVVPPLSRPPTGLTLATAMDSYVYPPAKETAFPSRFVTTTSADPAAGPVAGLILERPRGM